MRCNINFSEDSQIVETLVPVDAVVEFANAAIWPEPAAMDTRRWGSAVARISKV